MKKVLKITGVVALIITLVANLQYAIFSYDITNTPNKALAAWVDVNGTKYCGSSPENWFRTGYWTWVADDFYADPANGYASMGEYSEGFYYFTPSNYGGQCGPANPPMSRWPGPGYPEDPWEGLEVTYYDSFSSIPY